MQHNKYIQVIVPLKIGFEPYYKTDRNVSVGDRIPVKLSGKEYTAVVSAVDVKPDLDDKRISVLPDPYMNPLPPVSREEIAFWRFLSDYYLCTVGEVYKAAYPDHKTKGEAAYEKLLRQQADKSVREQEQLSARVERLENLLKKKEENLLKKHNADVTARLAEERDKTLRKLEEARALIEASQKKEEDKGKLTNVTRTKDPKAKEVLERLSYGKPVLLTGSRQDDNLIAECVRDTLASGMNCLVLIPEIETGGNLVTLLKKTVGNRLRTFTSDESMGRRRVIANELREGECARAYIGTRSSLFLPWKNLGLIIVESEENPSHKAENAPRMNARDAAVMLAHIHGCRILLTSTCPSLESYRNAVSGKYQQLTQNKASLAPVTVVDTTAELPKGGVAGNFSIRLLKEINQMAKNGGRTLILHPWTAENILEDLIRYARDVADTVTIKNIYSDKYSNIEEYSLVAILKADRIGGWLDFRADERRLQLLTHIRASFNGRMLIQTRSDPESYTLDPEQRLQCLLAERQEAGMPPCGRIINIIFKDASDNRLKYLGELLYEDLVRAGLKTTPPAERFSKGEPEPGVRVLRVLLKPQAISAQKKMLYAQVSGFELAKKYTGHIVIDVDPV